MKKIIGILALVFLVSCTPTKLSLKSGAKIEILSLCVNYYTDIPNEVEKTLNENLSDFITQYNKEQHTFKLSPCTDSNESVLTINIEETILVSKERQISSTLFSVVGMALPFVLIAIEAPVVIFFYTFPNAVSLVTLELSPDIAEVTTIHNRTISNSGYLRSEEKQIYKHGIAFKKFLALELKRIEKAYEN